MVQFEFGFPGPKRPLAVLGNDGGLCPLKRHWSTSTSYYSEFFHDLMSGRVVVSSWGITGLVRIARRKIGTTLVIGTRVEIQNLSIINQAIPLYGEITGTNKFRLLFRNEADTKMFSEQLVALPSIWKSSEAMPTPDASCYCQKRISNTMCHQPDYISNKR